VVGGDRVLSRYDAVLAALDAGVVVHASDTHILDANERARELLGIVDLEDRLVNDPSWQFLEADGSPMALERFPVMQVLTTGRSLRRFPGIIRRPDGPETWVEVSAEPVNDEAGQIQQVVVTFIDVTMRRLAESHLIEAEEEARLVFERSQIATCLVANDGRLTRVNPAMCNLLGRSEAELLSMSFLEVTHPDDRELGMELVHDLLTGRRSSFRVTKRYITGSGRTVWGDLTVSAVANPDGSVHHRIAQIIDVTAEHTLRQSLMEAERIAHLGTWRLDLATGHVVWSPELYAIFGLDPSGTPPDLEDHRPLLSPESWELLRQAVIRARDFGTPYELEVEAIRTDGAHRWVEVRGEAVRDANGAIVELHGASLDITDRKRARDELAALATRDPLTGLANRAVLLEELTRGVQSSHRSSRPLAVLMMDLDRFKSVNDTLGHSAGDDLLVAAATRLGEVVRSSDLVARLGGDEFVVVMRDLADTEEAMHAAERIVTAFRAPFTVAGNELFATACVGVAIATQGSGPGDLLRESDTALYAAKAAGRDRVALFNEDLREAVTTRVTVEVDLRHALERGQLELWYQPEVDLARGTVVAVEALLRWRHPDGTVWSADRFVEVAEETGLILDIGDWVLRQACINGAAWAAMRPSAPLTVRVNVSALQLAEAGLLEAVDDALAGSGLDPTSLCVEITETALLTRTSGTTANLAGLHERGISLAIDDFGTGYASLAYLHRYPVDVIKIDRSFITDATDRDLVAGIVALAATLGVGVTAEGVETPEQADRLRQIGCPSAQGWLFSKAVPVDDVAGLLCHVYPRR
jgi:diguanylate cyclase (GGDEF)-like protein/PAS domain S-box-containing protein